MRLKKKVINLVIVSWLYFGQSALIGQSSYDDKYFYNLDSARVHSDSLANLLLANVNEVPDICIFPNIKYLELRSFYFEKIEGGISCSDSLETLILTYGRLKDLSISLPKNLKELDLSHNHLTADAIKKVKFPKGLKILKLGNNPIQGLKPSVFKNLPFLEELILYESSLKPLHYSLKEKEGLIKLLPKNCKVWFNGYHPYQR
jgi:Leucine-rich repeat (LRR) protein